VDGIPIAFATGDRITEKVLRVNEPEGVTVFQKWLNRNFYFFHLVPVLNYQMRAIAVEPIRQ